MCQRGIGIAESKPDHSVMKVALLLDLKVEVALPELMRFHVFNREPQLVVTQGYLLRHVYLVNNEVISAMVLANFWFHRQQLVGHFPALRVDDLIAPLEL